MSRIGKLPVNLPAGVTVTVSPENEVSVKGPLGTLTQKVDSDITVTVEGSDEEAAAQAMENFFKTTL